MRVSCEPGEADDTVSSRETGVNPITILPAGTAGKGRMAALDINLVDAISRQLSEPTAKCAMETLGISIRTWGKLRNGEPVRASLAERLVERVRRGGGAGPAQMADC